jgi:hypothetical protein
MGRMLLDESVDGKERFRWNSRIASRLKINEKGIAEYKSGDWPGRGIGEFVAR